jgi:DNA uptake protein ComE-like DNA-binding protein
MQRRAAFVLPIVLIVIGLLALTMAGYVFFVRAEVSGTTAHSDSQQALLAAESGLNEVMATLRLEPHNAVAWFDSPQRFRHKLIWCGAYERDQDPVAKAGVRNVLYENGASPAPAWRFSVVADRDLDPSGLDNKRMRFGITPESSKLNLNEASEEQVTELLMDVLPRLQIENTSELINALLDWRDPDSDIREGGAESEYYNTLDPPYNAKNGPFDSVEELLLVKGFNAVILYGEDVNRNGILDENENDGAESFPGYDDHNGVLDRGIAPFLTVCSREPDTSLDNRPRIDLTQNAATIATQIEATFSPEELEICDSAITFIEGLKAQNYDFTQMGSVAELYREGLVPAADATTPDPLAASPITLEQLPYILDRFSVPRPEQQSQQDQEQQQEQQQQEEQPQGPEQEQAQAQPESQTPDQAHPAGPNQLQPGGQGQKPPTNPNQGQTQDQPQGQRPEQTRGSGSGSSGNSGQKAGSKRQAIRPGQQQGEEQSDDEEVGSGQEQPQAQGPGQSQIQPQGQAQTQGQSQSQGIPGLININTASRRVLALIPGITPEAVEAIINGRPGLTAEAARTPAWLLSAGVDTATFHAIAPWITTKSYQYHVEVLGYADHNRVMKRCEWIIEMIGPVAQVRYFRDLTALGMAWPIDDEDIAGNAVQTTATGR